jgi:hypothetical protein
MADTASGPEGSKSEAGPKSGAGPAGQASPDGTSAEDESRRKFREALERKRAKEADPGRGRGRRRPGRLPVPRGSGRRTGR